MAPSQLIFTTPCNGRYHQDQVEEGAECVGGAGRWIALNLARYSAASEAIE